MEKLKQLLINDERYREGLRKCLDNPQILVAPTNYCNMACDYCSTKNIRNAKVNMEFDLFKSIVSQCVDMGWSLSFGQTYEPFLHPRIQDMVEFVKQKGRMFMAATNGIAIRPEAYGLPMTLLMSFSATEEDYRHRNCAVPYEKYREKLYTFIRHRIEHDSEGMISIQIADYSIFDGDPTYDKAMKNISAIIEKTLETARGLDVEIDYNQEEWEQKIAVCTPLPLYVNGKIRIQIQPTKIVPNSFDAFMKVEMQPVSKGYCDSCYTMMSIQADGQVAYCCCDPSANAIAGTISADTDIKSFWLGEEMQQVRDSFNAFAPIHSFCTSCLTNVTENIKPLLTVKDPALVAEILREHGVTEDLPWFKFPAGIDE